MTASVGDNTFLPTASPGIRALLILEKEVRSCTCLITVSYLTRKTCFIIIVIVRVTGPSFSQTNDELRCSCTATGVTNTLASRLFTCIYLSGCEILSCHFSGGKLIIHAGYHVEFRTYRALKFDFIHLLLPILSMSN